jgi:hypothetical protein
MTTTFVTGAVRAAREESIRAIVDMDAKLMEREFANVTSRCDIEWFWTVDETCPEHDLLSRQKEFYALNLVNADAEIQLSGYA